LPGVLRAEDAAGIGRERQAPYSAIPDRVENAPDWIEDIERLSAVA